MTLGLLPWVMLAGAGGAVIRYLVTLRVDARRPQGYPFGTLGVNLAGAFGAGFTVGWMTASGGSSVGVVAAVGFFGALTTFSTWTVQAVELWRTGKPGLAAIHLFGGLAAGTALALLGARVGA